jgi:hypothetical protein
MTFDRTISAFFHHKSIVTAEEILPQVLIKLALPLPCSQQLLQVTRSEAFAKKSTLQLYHFLQANKAHTQAEPNSSLVHMFVATMLHIGVTMQDYSCRAHVNVFGWKISNFTS